MSKIVAVASLVMVLVFVNWSIFQKERHLAEGRTVYLALAPVDPRSLMQGDYMALHFELADKVSGALSERARAEGRPYGQSVSEGYVVVRLDERNIGFFKELYNDQVLSENDMIIRYRVRDGAVKLATNAFFFQEGHVNYYEQARYGQFRVNDKGELLLVALYDRALNLLGKDEGNARGQL